MHAYICECDRNRCRRRLHLTRPEYKFLAALGTVVSPECARTMERKAIAWSPAKNACAVPTKKGRFNELRRRTAV